MTRVELIASASTLPLRHRILRPHQRREDCVYPGDAMARSFHVGVFDGEHLVCVASFSPESTPRANLHEPCRLRGMATNPSHQRQGLGTQALGFGEVKAKELGFAQLWCNARTSALGFYTRLGFEEVSDRFEIEGIGPHVVLCKPL